MEYKKYKLGEIASFTQGKQVDINEQFFVKKEGMKRFVRIIDYTNSNEPIRYVNNFGKRYYVSSDEVAMIRYGSQTAGMVVLGKDGIIANNLFKILINNEIALNKYIFYFLSQKYIFNYLRKSQSSSTMPAISFNIMNNLEIYIPSKDCQRKIVKILSDIDKKIELNNQINNNLFEFLKTYYKEHFIDNENKNMKKMCDLVKETVGGDWGKDKITDNYNQEVLCIRGADIPDMDRGNKGKTPKRFILEKNVEKKQLCGKEIVIEISGGSPTQSTGRCAYITKMLESSFELPIICTNFCRAIRLKDDKYLPSFYMNLKYLYEKNIMFLYENGTTGIKNLDLSSFLDNEEINIIEDEENQKFNNLYYNINNKMIKNAEENRILEQLRDTLLPKLMNGEISLDNVEI